MERIEIRLKKDLPEKFKNEWNWFIRPFMVKGWKTWVDLGRWEQYCLKQDIILPEENKYGINFPSKMFEIIDKQ